MHGGQTTRLLYAVAPPLGIITQFIQQAQRNQRRMCMLFWLQLISCSRFVSMAELHHLCDESSSSCSSDKLVLRKQGARFRSRNVEV